MSQATEDQITMNRQKHHLIIETIVPCGRQNIPLRGHHDSTLDVERAPSGQHGNFWALLQFRATAGDEVLKNHLAQSSRNATYTSSRIQNQILDVLGSTIVRRIVHRVEKACYYTLIADEVTDCSNKEQLSLVLRYVNPDDNLIREDFHCASHCLNLAVVKSLDERSIRNIIGVVNRVSILFAAHPKRQRKLEEIIDQAQLGLSVKKLKDLCRTRWVERIDVLDRSKKLHSSLVSCFDSISDEGSRNWTPESLTDANTLQLAISTTEFLSALVITSSTLNYLMALTKSLQSEAKDIIEAVFEINNLTSVLQDIRDNIDSHHDVWFTEVEQMSRAIGTEPSLPRLCGRQIHHSNVPSQTPTEYYPRTIFIPLLDHILTEMDSRFSKHQQTAFTGLLLVPSVLVPKSLSEATSKPAEWGELYSNDLPSPNSLQGEIDTWYLKWTREKHNHGAESLPTSLFSL